MNNTNILTNQAVYDLINRQLAVWQQASDNFAALANVGVKEITVGGFPVKVQFNPARIISSAAKLSRGVDSAGITAVILSPLFIVYQRSAELSASR